MIEDDGISGYFFYKTFKKVFHVTLITENHQDIHKIQWLC